MAMSIEARIKELGIELPDAPQYLGESLGWVECLNEKWVYGWIPAPKLEKV